MKRLPRSGEGAKAWSENEMPREIVDSARHLHGAIGPGLLESVYDVLPAGDLKRRGLRVKRQFVVPFMFRGWRSVEGFRADLIELKSVESFTKSDPKPLRTYRRLLNMEPGLLINFYAPLLKDGIIRTVNRLEDDPRSTTLRTFATSRED